MIMYFSFKSNLLIFFISLRVSATSAEQDGFSLFQASWKQEHFKSVKEIYHYCGSYGLSKLISYISNFVALQK